MFFRWFVEPLIGFFLILLIVILGAIIVFLVVGDKRVFVDKLEKAFKKAEDISSNAADSYEETEKRMDKANKKGR